MAEAEEPRHDSAGAATACHVPPAEWDTSFTDFASVSTKIASVQTALATLKHRLGDTRDRMGQMDKKFKSLQTGVVSVRVITGRSPNLK